MHAPALLATLSLTITSVLAFASPQLGTRLLARGDKNQTSFPSMYFSGTVAGQPFNVTGDVRDAVAELHRRFPSDPKFDPAVIERESKSSSFEASLVTLKSSLLNTRDDSFKDLLCAPVPGQSWGFANIAAVDHLIHYILALTDRGIGCGVKEWGPEGCIRLACTGGTGIFWCNDNPVPITRSCTDLAGYAAEIRNGCRANRPGVCGQCFSNGGWNIVVRADTNICW